MDEGDLVEEVVKSTAAALGVSVALDASERAAGFAHRYPRVVRAARLAGGAFLVFAGLLEVVITIVGLALIVSSEPFHVGMLIVLLPLAFGAGLVVWGLSLMRRGWGI